LGGWHCLAAGKGTLDFDRAKEGDPPGWRTIQRERERKPDTAAQNLADCRAIAEGLTAALAVHIVSNFTDPASVADACATQLRSAVDAMRRRRGN
jgi:hypothetical protein